MVFNKKTAIVNYIDSAVIIKVSFDNDIATIDVLNEQKKTILDSPIEISNYPYCALFAWGDNRNPFEINATIMEFKRD